MIGQVSLVQFTDKSRMESHVLYNGLFKFILTMVDGKEVPKIEDARLSLNQHYQQRIKSRTQVADEQLYLLALIKRPDATASSHEDGGKVISGEQCNKSNE